VSSPRRGSRVAGVVIIEPIGIVRVSLRALFESVPDIEVLGETGDADLALDLVARIKNHSGVVVLLGVELSGEHDSFWLIRAIRERSPSLTILATGTDLQPGAISQALFMGADGFIHKNSEPERFVEATRRASAGELVLEGLPRGALGSIVERMDPQRAPAPVLTERELMVLSAASEGLTAREIGRRLDVSERTVTTHLNHIYRKLGASGRIAAVSTAMRLGVLSLPDVGGVLSAPDVASDIATLAVS
jgi:DNA-binding NarL/FixJ family response regulator